MSSEICKSLYIKILLSEYHINNLIVKMKYVILQKKIIKEKYT